MNFLLLMRAKNILTCFFSSFITCRKTREHQTRSLEKFYDAFVKWMSVEWKEIPPTKKFKKFTEQSRSFADLRGLKFQQIIERMFNRSMKSWDAVKILNTRLVCARSLITNQKKYHKRIENNKNIFFFVKSFTNQHLGEHLITFIVRVHHDGYPQNILQMEFDREFFQF